MCGIFGVTGAPHAVDHVLAGLRRLEYRGYDSSGLAWLDGELHVHKALGGIDHLDPKTTGRETAALGHTRWATHGRVTQDNAHPHVDCDGDAAIVHNGILTDHQALRARLQADGHEFRSDTDSEALAHLWEDRTDDPLAHLRTLTANLEGTYAVAVLDRRDAAIYVAKRRTPLWVAATDDAAWLASDPAALQGQARDAIPLEDGDHGRLTPGGLELRDADGNPVTREPVPLDDVGPAADRAGYEHHMLKEIHETPAVLNRPIARYVRLTTPYVELGLPDALVADVRRLLLVGAGTSHHAAMLGAHYARRLAGLPAQAAAAPEHKDSPDVPEAGTLLVALSQSGETYDTLQTLRRLEPHGLPTLAITNHSQSAISRAANTTLRLDAGPEAGVAATKTFLSQTLLLYLLGLQLGHRTGRQTDATLRRAAADLKRFPRAIERTLHRTPQIQDLARGLARYDHAFLLAKGLNLPAAQEGALKLKEIAYQHAEAFPAGELKHGPFALLTEDTPVLFLLAPGAHEAAVRQTLAEVAARGAPTTVLALDDVDDPGDDVGRTLRLPAAPPDLQPLVFSTALHLLAYWVAKARGLPIDRPRNLAKSVTVE